MKITFRIHYDTQWGQRLAVTGNLPALGAANPAAAPFMEYVQDGVWELTLDITPGKAPLTYKYLLTDENRNVLREDWGELRSADLSKEKVKEIVLSDVWRDDRHAQNSLFTSAFSDAIFRQKKHKVKAAKKAAGKGQLILRIYAPRVSETQQVCVCGSSEVLGKWNSDNAVLLENSNFPLWSTATLFVDNQEDTEYKFGIYDTKEKRVLFLEAGENRRIAHYHLPEDRQKLVITNAAFYHPEGDWKGAGVAVPVFSLRSKTSLGVGEFTDIKGLVDWSEKVGLKMVQILPVNDTNATKTWTDSYPYAAVSVFALHPQYLNISAIDEFKKAIDQKAYNKEQKRLNALPEVDYEDVMRYKLKAARAIFEQVKTDFLQDAAFEKFSKENAHWLKPYAAFCYLRDKNGTAEFRKWSAYKKFSEAGLKKLTDPKAKHFDEIAFWYFIQFHLDRQLKAAGDYARGKGIILKGDIPIGIYRHSADAWTQPELYNMDGQSGAPPDPFSEIGQNWGFPTYNWEEMAKDGFQWWKNRFTQLSRYFDAFRIDHILGFFRIWQIPTEQVQGSFGFFNPAIPVARREFGERGIWFDFERYCQPFITEKIMVDTFGAEAQTVGEQFMEKADDRIVFREAFDTQRKVEAFVKKHPQFEQHKENLYSLLANVLFFPVPGSENTEFHPRIEMMKTSSFQHLPADMKPRVEALYNDYFYNRQEDFWRESAMAKLPAIRAATNMLICGEDLGMVPDCVPGVMDDLNILTLEIQRMSKNPNTEFLQEKDIPYLSVASPSTHDMSPLRLWWEETDAEQRARFYRRELNGFEAVPEACTPRIAKRILQQHLQWKSMWVVFPLQDILAISGNLRRENPEEERINVPANPQHYWRFRFHVDTEDLLDATDLNEDLQRMILVSGRG